MIGYISGTIIGTYKDTVIIETASLGYKVYTTTPIKLKEVGSTVSLWTYLAVRETALDLYGFEDPQELSMFESLLSVSGIGPRSALAALDTAGVPSLKRSIGRSDPALLTKIAGIGKKTAEKIVLELKGKIEEDINDTSHTHSTIETIDALVSLGYSERQARESYEKIKDKDAPTTELIKEALKYIP